MSTIIVFDDLETGTETTETLLEHMVRCHGFEPELDAPEDYYRAVHDEDHAERAEDFNDHTHPVKGS